MLFHDESTFHANKDQTSMWGIKGPQNKSEMVTMLLLMKNLFKYHRHIQESQSNHTEYSSIGSQWKVTGLVINSWTK